MCTNEFDFELQNHAHLVKMYDNDKIVNRITPPQRLVLWTRAHTFPVSECTFLEITCTNKNNMDK